MTVRIIRDPIADPEWAALLERHPAASIFHTPAWLQALRQTYGYEPFVLTTSTDVLNSGIVLCRVKGWMNQRLVSVPFSDHCQPLVNSSSDLSAMIGFVMTDVAGAQAIELRPATVESSLRVAATACDLRADARYVLHRLDLRPNLGEIFQRFHHSSTRRAVRRAEREKLMYEAGTSSQLLSSFYRLLRMTRRRHGLPPQPIAWFRNLASSLGESLTVHLASKNGQPIAAILTLSFKRTLVYKYGGSDAAYHRLGAVPFLFWRAIRDAKSRGFEELDLGRSDLDQAGLMEFKRHLGAESSPLTYYRHPPQGSTRNAAHWASAIARQIFSRLPDPALDAAGRLLYKHLG